MHAFAKTLAKTYRRMYTSPLVSAELVSVIHADNHSILAATFDIIWRDATDINGGSFVLYVDASSMKVIDAERIAGKSCEDVGGMMDIARQRLAVACA